MNSDLKHFDSGQCANDLTVICIFSSSSVARTSYTYQQMFVVHKNQNLTPSMEIRTVNLKKSQELRMLSLSLFIQGSL